MPEWTDGLPDDAGYDRYGGPEGDLGMLLVEADLEHEAYQFGLVKVWMTPDGSLRAAADRGCSCPTPFSGLTLSGTKAIREVADLEPLIAYARGSIWDDGDPRDGQIKMSITDLKARVHRALRDADGRPLEPWRGYSRTSG